MMPVTVEKWLDAPIIVLKPDAEVTQRELIDAWFRSAELAQTMAGGAFRIVDLSASPSPDAVTASIRGILRAIAGSPIDVSLHVSFVGSVGAVSSASQADGETWFETFDEALNHIYAMAAVASIPT